MRDRFADRKENSIKKRSGEVGKISIIMFQVNVQETSKFTRRTYAMIATCITTEWCAWNVTVTHWANVRARRITPMVRSEIDRL